MVGKLLALLWDKAIIPHRSIRLISRSFAVYLLFVPPVLAFVGIFAISLRNQFAEFTNL